MITENRALRLLDTRRRRADARATRVDDATCPEDSVCELVDRSSWRTRADARLAVFDYIEAFYNPRRRHQGLGQRSPAEFERRYRSEQLSA